jgi:predicted RNase H-like nuclease (RuvC/YqgF family)
MIYSDINFYLFLALGFVVYVIWGFLLHYVLHKSRELQPDKAAELRLENLNRKIGEQREELGAIVSKLNNLKSQISTLENEINDKQQDVIGYENGVIPVNISMLKSSIGDFMNGWFAYTVMMYPKNANKRNQEATEKQNEWLTKKLESLASEK